MSFRVKQQFGYFTLEQQVEVEEKSFSFKSAFLPFIFKPKIRMVKKWMSIREGLSLVPKQFESIENAKNYLKELKPIYHPIEPDSK